MFSRTRPSAVLFLALLCCAFATEARAQTGPSGEPAGPPPAITGISGTRKGNLLVSPPPGGSDVLEIAPDGSLARSWPIPAGAAVEVVDADPDGRPVCLDPHTGKVWILKEKDQGAPDWLLLSNIKGLDPQRLAPVIRGSSKGEIVVAEKDGSAIHRISMAGIATRVPLLGQHGAVGDFDISTDGHLGFLDPTTGTLRLYASDGALLWEAPLAVPGGQARFEALVRFTPDSNDAWVLDLPLPGGPNDGAPGSGLQRIEGSSGKRLGRIDHYPDKTPFESTLGLAATHEGVWMATTLGEARRIAAGGGLLARFDVAPAPPGMSWTEKQRLQLVSRDPAKASLADAVAALGVVRKADDADALMDRLIGSPAEAQPLLLEATRKGTVATLALANFLDRTLPANRAALTAAFHDPSPLVRSAAVIVLRDPEVQGYQQELEAACADPASADLRGGAIIVLSRHHRWSPAAPALMMARLDDSEPQIALLAAQLMAARLPDTVAGLTDLILDPKASGQAREMASRAVLLDVPEGNKMNTLGPDHHAELKKLAASPLAVVKRVGVLALIVHGDPKGAEMLPSIWGALKPEHRALALNAWGPAFGDKGADALINLLGKEKDPATRALLMRSLHRNGGSTSRNWLVKLAMNNTAAERDRVVALDLAKRRLSDSQVLALADELLPASTDLRRAILHLIGERNVVAAAPKIAALATDRKDRGAAFVALYQLGSKEGVPAALAVVRAGNATATEFSYLAAVGGLPEETFKGFEVIAAGSGPMAVFAAEALARSGDAAALPMMVATVKADHYGTEVRDGALPGAVAALGDPGREAAIGLLSDSSPAAREDAAMALALQGGDSCKPLADWKETAGVAVPSAFFALSACGQNLAAAAVYRQAANQMQVTPTDPISQTATPEGFAALLATLLRQPDYRSKAEPVLAAVSALPRPMVAAVANALSTDLDPGVAGAAMKHVFSSLGGGTPQLGRP